MKAAVLLYLAFALLTGCNAMRVEYEHISHPLAGPPFGPMSEEDSLDHVQVCAVRRRKVFYNEVCAGYMLADGGFYGPRLTGAVRAGMLFDIGRMQQ